MDRDVRIRTTQKLILTWLKVDESNVQFVGRSDIKGQFFSESAFSLGKGAAGQKNKMYVGSWSHLTNELPTAYFYFVLTSKTNDGRK